MENKVRLYELVLENGRSASPFVWRIRYSLAHNDHSLKSWVERGFDQYGGLGRDSRLQPLFE